MQRRGFLAGGLAVGLARPAIAQSARAIRLVLPGPSGGPTDAILRHIADRLPPLLNQPVFVDNRPGASGAIGASEVARSLPDANLFLFCITDVMINNVALFRTLPYDPLRDFTPMTQVAFGAPVMVTGATGPADLEDLVRRAGATPGGLPFASWGPGTIPHIVMAEFARRAGVPFTHVPYRGATPGLQDVMAGHVAVGFTSANAVTSSNGLFRGLAAMGDRRIPILPETPSFVERGFDDPAFRLTNWFGFFAPSRAVPDTTQRLTAAIRTVAATAETAAFIRSVGVEPLNSSPDEFRRSFAAEFPLRIALIKSVGVEPE